jgi:hypothetical protein
MEVDALLVFGLIGPVGMMLVALWYAFRVCHQG